MNPAISITKLLSNAVQTENAIGIAKAIKINKNTGAATVETNITFGGNNLEDIEALAFTIYNSTISIN